MKTFIRNTVKQTRPKKPRPVRPYVVRPKMKCSCC